MKFTISAVAVSALALASSAAAQVTINTPPPLYTCQNALLSWSGGQAPYYVRVNQGGSTTNTLETIQNGVDSTSYSWQVNQPAGTSVTLAITDGSGQTNYADAVTIQDGGDTSCIGASASSGASSTAASSSAASSSSAAGSSSSAAATTGSQTSRSSQNPSATESTQSGTAASQSAQPTNGAASLALSGLAGVAAVGAALLA
ncbi:hypothetical protein Rhopal_007540-T1 [Rhodotorula paludigena]|uniref:Uncharacterized protein n=1 Tax=Rhodotorula paludigena TaxID=86838 RepID=A0AAV5GPF2_9BASI|nr:hypothetical protein Rhopal_007540-T1 [Rhodotorula paludigena]